MICMRKVNLKDAKGEIYYSLTMDSEEELSIKKKLKDQAIYNLLFLSKEYTSRDDAFDFIEFSSIDNYGKIFFLELDTYKFINDENVFCDKNISTFIEINRGFSELVKPDWDEEILRRNGPWGLLRVKARNFLDHLGIPYKEINLDHFIEQNGIG